MNWKMLAHAVRWVNRPFPSARVRYRPNLDVLEDRVVLSPVHFSEVQNQSPLTLSGSLAGQPIQPQGTGALTTTYFGDFQTDIDEANSAIKFIATGNDFCAADTGNWAPLPDGSNGTAPAIYGLQVTVRGPSFLAAIRDFHMNADTGGTALKLYSIGSGKFGFPSTQTITISAGTGTYAAPFLGSGLVTLSGWKVTNQAADGTLVDNGNGTFSITIPINVSYSGTIGGIGVTLNFNGQIVGSGAYGAPTSGSHAEPAIGGDLVSSIHASGVVPLTAISTNAQGLVSDSRPDVAQGEMPAPVQDMAPSDAGALLVHPANPAIDPVTVLDTLLQGLA